MKLAQRDDWEEGLDEEIVGKLMELRGYLEKRLKDLEDELEKLRALFKIVDEIIVSKSFRRAETLPITPLKPGTPLPSSEPVEGVPLKTTKGVLLAEMFVGPQDLRIVSAEDLAFSINTPPFQSFFVSRILEPMRVKDEEAVQKGEILPETALSYDVVTDGDIIREVVVRNYGGERRLQEIKSSCRWTLEKMYERTHQS